MYDFKFSDIGEGLHEGKILKWFVKVGDQVKEGDTLVVVETDKVNAELPSPATGVITKIGTPEGEIIHVGETVVIIDDGEGESAKVEQKVEAKTEAPKAAAKEKESAPGVIGEIEVSSDIIAASEEQKEASANVGGTRVLATPVARKLAKDLGVDITTLRGQGENGRVMKEDILNAAESATKTIKIRQTPVVEPLRVQGEVERVKISGLRKSIVRAMANSKQIIPHTVLMDEVAIDQLVALRQAAKVQAEKQGIKLTYMAFIIKAVTIALKEFPGFNASFDEANEEMVYKKYINVGIAVDTTDGLIVPNIKDAEAKSIFALARELREVGDATKARKIALSALQNTTFTITNFGAADIAYGTPIINHPEVAILGIGKIAQKPIVKNGEIVIAYVLPLSLAVDHRVIDGADGGRFLMRIKQLLSEPTLLLME